MDISRRILLHTRQDFYTLKQGHTMIKKTKYLQLLLILNIFMIIESSITFAQEFLDLGPMPDKIHIDGNDRFFLDYGSSIIYPPSKIPWQERLFNELHRP